MKKSSLSPGDVLLCKDAKFKSYYIILETRDSQITALLCNSDKGLYTRIYLKVSDFDGMRYWLKV